MVNFDPVGGFMFFKACRVTGLTQASNHFFTFLWDGCESN
jgi:hypothetical protein